MEPGKGQIKTLCDIGKCPTCNAQYAVLRESGMLVVASCEHGWKLGPRAETRVNYCEICDQPMICDPSGKLVYLSMCTCYRDQTGMFSCQNDGLHRLNLEPIGAEFSYIESQLKKILENQKVIILVLGGIFGRPMGSTITPQEQMPPANPEPPAPEEPAPPSDISQKMKEAMMHEADTKSFRCPMFTACGKANATKKSCKDPELHKECPHLPRAPEPPKTETPKAEPPKMEPPKVEPPKTEAPKTEEKKPETPTQ